MSRAKFEEWCKNKETHPNSVAGTYYWEAWLAGRESMREEVTPIIFGQCDSDNVAQRTVDEIMKL